MTLTVKQKLRLQVIATSSQYKGKLQPQMSHLSGSDIAAEVSRLLSQFPNTTKQVPSCLESASLCLMLLAV